MGHIKNRSRGRGHEGWMFVRHFLEMCVAMCVGGGALNAVAFVAGPRLVGYTDLREETPALALLIIALIYVAPMAAWMRFRGMAWRPVVEMSGAVVLVAVVLVGLAASGVITESNLRSSALGFCGPACLAMLPVMLLRLGLYTGRTDAPQPQSAESSLGGRPLTEVRP